MNRTIEQLEKQIKRTEEKQEQKKQEALEALEKINELEEVYWQQKARKQMEDNKWMSKKRKMETHAKILFGGMLVALDSEKDWTKLNPTKLYNFLQAGKEIIAESIFDNEGMESSEANKRIRAFEKQVQTNKKN